MGDPNFEEIWSKLEWKGLDPLSVGFQIAMRHRFGYAVLASVGYVQGSARERFVNKTPANMSVKTHELARQALDNRAFGEWCIRFFGREIDEKSLLGSDLYASWKGALEYRDGEKKK